MLKAIFWDNDGVLVDSEYMSYRATRDALARVGVVLTEEMYVQFFLKQSCGAWHLAAERGIPEDG